jgi:hypothetical protein
MRPPLSERAGVEHEAGGAVYDARASEAVEVPLNAAALRRRRIALERDRVVERALRRSGAGLGRVVVGEAGRSAATDEALVRCPRSERRAVREVSVDASERRPDIVKDVRGSESNGEHDSRKL